MSDGDTKKQQVVETDHDIPKGKLPSSNEVEDTRNIFNSKEMGSSPSKDRKKGEKRIPDDYCRVQLSKLQALVSRDLKLEYSASGWYIDVRVPRQVSKTSIFVRFPENIIHKHSHS